jgi:pseudouridine-5'-phosphate glycosidase
MIKYSREVLEAIKSDTPIVALESTIISHGLPRPSNLETALAVEAIVRSNAATPATIAVIQGEVHIGLEGDELEMVADSDSFTKASIRDLPVLAAKNGSAATTVAATAHIAAIAGIEFFATGGLGGVHRGARDTWDESADLIALANSPVLVVCAGAKSILDVPATLERLETLSVPILGYRTNNFPGFYLSDSGYPLEHRVDNPDVAAQVWRARSELSLGQRGMIVANPVINQISPELHNRLLQEGLAAAERAAVRGKAVTPFLLEFFHANSGGESLRVNIEIIKSNAALAAQIAVAAR